MLVCGFKVISYGGAWLLFCNISILNYETVLSFFRGFVNFVVIVLQIALFNQIMLIMQTLSHSDQIVLIPYHVYYKKDIYYKNIFLLLIIPIRYFFLTHKRPYTN